MNFKLKSAAASVLAISMVALSANASDPAPPPPAKKHPAAKKAAPAAGPTVEEQIRSLRREMQGQIDGLKNDLADKDTPNRLRRMRRRRRTAPMPQRLPRTRRWWTTPRPSTRCSRL
jgi:hypothetical protein